MAGVFVSVRFSCNLNGCGVRLLQKESVVLKSLLPLTVFFIFSSQMQVEFCCVYVFREPGDYFVEILNSVGRCFTNLNKILQTHKVHGIALYKKILTLLQNPVKIVFCNRFSPHRKVSIGCHKQPVRVVSVLRILFYMVS